ncbi:MAG: allophanate hydrolase [Cyclobacteriaceae bacterium]|nr:MAG: allophanate hydrolase [Cyclobacteriaceae bacterium]
MPSGAEYPVLQAGGTTLDAAPFGEQGIVLSLQTSRPATETLNFRIALFNFLRQARLPFLLDVIPAVKTVTLIFDTYEMAQRGYRHPFNQALEWLREALAKFQEGENPTAVRRLRIPVCYDPGLAPDLTALAEIKNLNIDQIANLHCAATYRVLMLGFLPGFAYMGFVPKILETGRHAQPRKTVEAGSVGIAGNQTGIYPLPSPGGWFIIGRTPLQIFLPQQNEPTLFQPGDEVQFCAISREEFNNFSESNYNPF